MGKCQKPAAYLLSWGSSGRTAEKVGSSSKPELSKYAELDFFDSVVANWYH